jgi:DNA-binding MarR family transcriptional regulator
MKRHQYAHLAPVPGVELPADIQTMMAHANMLDPLVHQPTRLRLLVLLAKQQQAVRIQTLIEQLRLNTSNLSLHLARLRVAGLIETRRSKRWYAEMSVALTPTGSETFARYSEAFACCAAPFERTGEVQMAQQPPESGNPPALCTRPAHAHAIDWVVHDPVRLTILTLLIGDKESSFPGMQKKTGQTTGNLGAQIAKLEKAGYVDVRKVFRGRRRTTSYHLTLTGQAAWKAYWEQMYALMGWLGDGTETNQGASL